MAFTNETSTPSNTASLADRLRQKQKDDEQQIESIWAEHVENLKQLLTQEQNEIKSDLESLRSLTWQRMRRSVLPLSIIWGAGLLGILLAAASSWYVNSQVSQIEHQRAKLNSIPNLHISHACNGQTCVKIKPNKPAYGKHHQWRIIQQ